MKEPYGEAPKPQWIIKAPKPTAHSICRSCGKRTYLNGETRNCLNTKTCSRRVERRLAKEKR